MEKSPLVSVVIPTHNRPERLKTAVASVLAQTHAALEVIVVNDGGADVESVVRALDGGGRVTYIALGRNRERSAARNVGLRLATGKYVAYLDDDDWYEPDHVATLVEALESSGQAVAYADARRVWEERAGDGYRAVKADRPYSQAFDPELLLIGNYIPILCLMHRRDCLEQVGGFDETLATHEDWELFIRLSRRWTFQHVPRVTCTFTWREDGSSTTSSRADDFLRTTVAIYLRYADEAAKSPRAAAVYAQALEAVQRASTPRMFDCSIILPIRNRAELTRRCLTQLAAVTDGVEFEVIVVDNGSTDDTAAFLAALSGDVQVLRNPHDVGLARACNQGAAAARGRHLVFLGQDAVPEPGWLSTLVARADADPGATPLGVGASPTCLLVPRLAFEAAGRFDEASEGLFLRRPSGGRARTACLAPEPEVR
jgi:glycosyltransferase involved in cell wall biosynthesis